MSIRVLVVDDSALFRRVVGRALEGVPDVEVVGFCRNGREALERLSSDPPDLLTLDIEMPEVNGLDVLQAIRKMGLEVGVVVLSAQGDRAREMTVRALELGAFDFLTKPEGADAEQNLAQLRDRLAPLILAAGHRVQVRALLRGDHCGDNGRARAAVPVPVPAAPRRAPVEAPAGPAARPARVAERSKPSVVLIGVSTGGPVALTHVIPQLPSNLGVPVVVVQHMPPLFTRNLAESLAARSMIAVTEAINGETAQPGHVYIAPGGSHLQVTRSTSGAIVLRTSNDPPENNCRPAVDYLFRSAAESIPGRSVAVILTGMGADGTRGLRLLKARGCFSIAQDEASCVVFGMPKEAIQAGVVDLVVPLNCISAAIVRAVQ